MQYEKYDKIIFGAGLYGLYSADFCGKLGQRVLVIEHDDAPFKRATYINQARVHMGYHYPRSYSTAIKSAGYFRRFAEDYGFCISGKFDQVYATSSAFSWTDANQFVAFCKAAEIRCDEVKPTRYFKEGLCDGAFLTEEYTYDAQILKRYFLNELEKMDNVDLVFNTGIMGEKYIQQYKDEYAVTIGDVCYSAPFVLNSTYASVNQLCRMFGFTEELFNIKYELCEIILCDVSDELKSIGLTVMDGPFFSIMPFGKTGTHSLTSVTFTPHKTSYDAVPAFSCQNGIERFCSPEQLGNCNDCCNRPASAWPYMSQLARKYVLDQYGFAYKGSLFSMKPILKASEIDDSRPTVIRVHNDKPKFISVLSGKINTVYDLDTVLLEVR